MLSFGYLTLLELLIFNPTNFSAFCVDHFSEEPLKDIVEKMAKKPRSNNDFIHKEYPISLQSINNRETFY